MELFNPTILHVLIKSIPERWMGSVSTKYQYNDQSEVFESQFEVIVNSLHEMLFGEIMIIFTDKNTNKKLGIIKIKTKIMHRNQIKYESWFDVLPVSYEYKADFYEKNLQIIDKSYISIVAQDVPGPLYLKNKDSLARRILNIFFIEHKAQMYEVFLNILLSTQKGTLLCRVNWLLGLISAEYYYNSIHGICNEKECNGISCNKEFCYNSYYDLPEDLLSQALNALRYSASAFADSIVTWRLSKRRNLAYIKDPRKKAILEHLEIREEDLFKDSLGDDKSISYIAFFESSERMVISFKGTTSGNEALHDINCEYVEFQDGYAHSGIKALSDNFILNSWPEIREIMYTKGIKKLLLTGHSLGAAVALIVHLRFKEKNLENVFEIETMGFGCPPIVSESIAQKEYKNIKIFNFGSDFVSRLSYGSVLDLKFICISVSSLYDYIKDKNAIIKNITEIRQYLLLNNLNTKLYHPGTLYHIKDFTLGDTTLYKYKKVDYMFFNELICSRKSPFDHIIHRTMNAFMSSLDKIDSSNK